MGKKLILIVEDNEKLRSSLKQHLLEAGFRTDCAADGVVGFSRFRLLKPDLVFLKDDLPRQTGFELLFDIRLDSDTPVIMASAWNSWKTELKCFKQGADDFIHMPYNNHVVTERIKKVLRRSGANQLIRVGRLTINPDARTACVDDPTGEIKLHPTPSEYKLLVCMATSPRSSIYAFGTHRTLLSPERAARIDHKYSHAQFKTQANCRRHWQLLGRPPRRRIRIDR